MKRSRRPLTRVGILATAVVLAAGACSASHAAAPAQRAASAPGANGTSSAPMTAQPRAIGLSATTAPWHLPDPVSRPVVVANGPGFDILGGLAPGDVSTARIVRVVPASGSAEVVGSLALAVHDSAGASFGGRDFVFGGGSYSTVSTVQAWSGNGSASEVGHLPGPRSDLAAVTVGTTAYVVGGFNGSGIDGAVLATSDGTTFTPVATLPIPVRYPAAAWAGGYLWVLGGVLSTSEGGTLETSAIQRVDPANGSAAVVGHLPEAMGHATAVTVDGTVFLLGGRSGSTPSAAILALDPATDSMQPAGSLPEAVSDAGSIVIGGTAYLVGGETTGPTDPLDAVVVLRPT